MVVNKIRRALHLKTEEEIQQEVREEPTVKHGLESIRLGNRVLAELEYLERRRRRMPRE